MCVCRSIRPGISVKRRRSITSAPAGGAAVPIEVMRSLSITMTALAITLPARVDHLAGADRLRRRERIRSPATATAHRQEHYADHEDTTQRSTRRETCFLLRAAFASSCFRGWVVVIMMRTSLLLPRTVPRSRARAPRGATTRANGPKLRIQLCSARSRQTSSDIVSAARWRVAQLLRRMPLARAHVVGDRRLELDLDVLGRSGMDAERVGKRGVRQFFDRRESLLEQRDVLDALDREGAHLAGTPARRRADTARPARRRGDTGCTR